MERIKAAIQKAKAVGSGTAQSAARRTVKLEKSSSEDLLDIVYEKTRVVELDPAYLRANRIITFDKTDPSSVAFDHLRTQVASRLRASKWKTLGIISPTQDCGKTVVAINLAISMACQTTISVLLVDFDLRKPAVAKCLGLDCRASLVDYLEDKVALPDILVNPGIPRLVVLPNDRSVQNASEVLSSFKAETLLDGLKSYYESRIIIFDLPPLLTTDDALAFLPQVDTVLMVVAEGLTTKDDIDASLRLLKSHNLLGTVLNKAHGFATPYY